MKLFLDQNLSRRLVGRLSNEYPGSGHVTEVGLDIASDRAIWEYAGERDYVIVSKDTDFRQLAFLYGPLRRWAVHPTFHPRTWPTYGDTGHHQPH